MEKKGLKNQGKLLPVSSSIFDALTAIREKNRHGAYRGGSGLFPQPGMYVGSREMILLGRLMVRWKDVVGQDLYRNTFPSRLFKGTLGIICSDSQWLQTLHFLKETIKQKIQKIFPDMSIKSVFGKLGTIPEEIQPRETPPWPDWIAENSPSLKTVEIDEALLETIERCAKKMQARLKGMLTEGQVLCSGCKANLVESNGSVCSVCQFRRREQEIIQVRHLVSDSPWLSEQDIRDLVPTIETLELDLIREQLLDETRDRVNILGETLKDCYDENTLEEFCREMIRAILLKTRRLPHEINLNDPANKRLLEPGWLETLREIVEEAPPC